MKQFFNKLLTLFLFLFSFALFYMATTAVFTVSFVNIALFVTAIFVLLQACGQMDKSLGYGKYNEENKPKDNTKDNTKNETHTESRHEHNARNNTESNE